MDTNIQFIIVAVASFVGAALANTGAWFVAKDADGQRNDFDFRKFISSLGSAAYASFGIAAAYQLTNTFGVKEVMSAVMLGMAAQFGSNKLRDL